MPPCDFKPQPYNVSNVLNLCPYSLILHYIDVLYFVSCVFKFNLIFVFQGISYEKVREIRQKHMVPGLLTYYKKPVMVHQVGILISSKYWYLIYKKLHDIIYFML